MPKEEPCLSEASQSATSNKNAKDKGNKTTLLTICDTKTTDGSSGSGSHCSSEKDSGYSDTGSDWQQTDVEDQRGNKSQSGGSNCAASSQSGQNNNLREDSRENPTLVPVRPELKPLYIIKNMVLKQPDIIQNRGQLLWPSGSRGASVSGTNHVIMVRPPTLVPATLQLHKPLSHKSNITGKKISGTYLPILNSYPRIAPHPSKKPPDKSSSNDESQNMSKRVCTEYKSDDTTVTRSVHEQHIHKQPKLAVSTCGLPGPSLSPTTDNLTSSSSTNVSSSQASSSASTPSLSTTRGFHRNIVINTHHHCLRNTVEVLKKSGLLDITLRTKELLRQSNATERDIAQLRQHSDLLCHTASTNPNSITAWENLHRVMAETGSYPNLSDLQTLQTPHTHSESANKLESISEDDRVPPVGENSGMPRCDLPTVTNTRENSSVPQQSQSEQGSELQSSDKPPDKVTFMPPDSSTG
ncbi:CLOCK-interacting pacemaker-like [Sphaeramia orbicularis]|uniref:CLOCK-interacting pacemaker-like n=1 Tax=Sphaeramia orbicularis TaxID=375764 RepID=A0A673BSK9_9TELE|nr:CLOCK-interacting pacemaker-like [Sphaeramia orbicularis]XP_030008927.1 CLOCK-interacting pacemaker-like [Sphaeramia orbicularis]XP_030008928.1 CLOCK-interacting pacemaker-like [Sphaeramia orbicularis]